MYKSQLAKHTHKLTAPMCTQRKPISNFQIQLSTKTNMESSVEGKTYIKRKERISLPAKILTLVFGSILNILRDKQFTICVCCKTAIVNTSSTTYEMKRNKSQAFNY